MGRPRSAHEVLAGIRTFNAAAGERPLELVLRRPGTDRQVGRAGIYMLPRQLATMASEISAGNSAHVLLVVRRT